MNISNSNQIEVAGRVKLGTGKGGLATCNLTHPSGTSAEIYLMGATVTGWRDSGGNDLLFVSEKAVFEAGKPIRGGIPICFPQFGPGPLPSHGFARILDWKPVASGVTLGGATMLELELTNSAETEKHWLGRQFNLRYKLVLSDTLEISLSTANTGLTDFSFTEALHTYFKIGDINNVAVTGLKGLSYIDKVLKGAVDTEQRERVTISGETDRVYKEAPNHLSIYDSANQRVFVVEKTGMRDAVVWNPWIDKSKALADLGDNEFPGFICVEAGNIAEAVTLKAGDTHVARMTLALQA